MTWKKWLKRTALGVAVYLVLQTLWLVAQREWQRAEGEREFAAAVAETEQTDPDWQWESLSAKRPIPPAGKNGAELIPRIKSLIPQKWGEGLDGQATDLLAIPPNVRFSDEVIADARQELALVQPAVQLARTLKDYPSGCRDIHLTPDTLSTPLEDTNSTRSVTRLLRWEVVLATEDGDHNRITDDLAAILNTSRSVGDEPFLISQLVRIACRTIAGRSLERALAHTELSDDRLATLQAAWAADAEEPLLLYSTRGERAAFDNLFTNLANGTVTLADISHAEKPFALSFENFGFWLYRGRLPADRAYAHRWLSQAVDAARLPLHEQPAAFQALPTPPKDDAHILSRALLPAVDKVAAPHWRSVAEARCAVVGIACERFRLKTGRWPKELSELPADLLAAVPLDPFDGMPLRYKPLADGAMVYSLGPDGTDDGGNLSRENSKAPGTDVGFQLWNTDRRRQPAPAQPAPEAPPPPPKAPDTP